MEALSRIIESRHENIGSANSRIGSAINIKILLASSLIVNPNPVLLDIVFLLFV